MSNRFIKPIMTSSGDRMELEVGGITKSKPLQVLDLIEKSKPTP